MPKNHGPILFDVDGVLADFVGGVLTYINFKNKTNWKHEDLRGDIRKYDFWNEGCEALVRRPGFALGLSPIDKGCRVVKKLLKAGETVVFVTSPYDEAPTWCYDRTEWLGKHFGATRDNIIFARSKQYVHGSVLVDDLMKNVFDWSEYWGRTSLLVDQPQNYGDEVRDKNIIRVTDEYECFHEIKKILDNQKRILR